MISSGFDLEPSPGEEAFRALGEETGAFTPVVSDDLAVFVPESLERFDAIVRRGVQTQDWAAIWS